MDSKNYWGRDVEQDGDVTLHATFSPAGITYATEPAPEALRTIPFSALLAVSDAVQEVETARRHAETLNAELNRLIVDVSIAEADLDAAEQELVEAQAELVVALGGQVPDADGDFPVDTELFIG